MKGRIDPPRARAKKFSKKYLTKAYGCTIIKPSKERKKEMDYITYLLIAAIIFILGFMVGWITHKCTYGEISDEEVFGLNKKGE